MHRIKIRACLFVLFVFMLNTMAWALNFETYSEIAAHHQQQGDDAESLKLDGSQGFDTQEETDCNHGCHLLQHLLGQLSDSTPLDFPSVSAACQSGPALGYIKNHPRAQERPPRTSFLA